MENKYYVYALLDQRKPGPFYYEHWKFDFEPFYIGKGSGKRAFLHDSCKSSNVEKEKIIKSILREDGEPHFIETKRSKLSETEAFNLERLLISKIGRLDRGFGPLTNKTDGGDGTSGNPKVWTVAMRKQGSIAQRERFKSLKERAKSADATRRWVKENPTKFKEMVAARNTVLQSSRHRAKMSVNRLEVLKRDPSISTRQAATLSKTYLDDPSIAARISRSLGGKPVEVYKNGKLVKKYQTLHACCRNLDLNIGNAHAVLNGTRNHTGGYSLVYSSSS